MTFCKVRGDTLDVRKGGFVWTTSPPSRANNAMDILPMTNNTASDELSRLIIRLLKVRSYLDTVRLAAEHQGQEMGETLPHTEVIEDTLLMVDQIREDLDDLRNHLSYGKAA